MGPISAPASVDSKQMPALLGGAQLPVIETHDTEIASAFVRSTVWVTLGKKNTSRGMSEHTCRDSGSGRKKPQHVI